MPDSTTITIAMLRDVASAEEQRPVAAFILLQTLLNVEGPLRGILALVDAFVDELHRTEPEEHRPTSIMLSGEAPWSDGQPWLNLAQRMTEARYAGDWARLAQLLADAIATEDAIANVSGALYNMWGSTLHGWVETDHIDITEDGATRG